MPIKLEGGLRFGSSSGQVEAVRNGQTFKTELRIIGSNEVIATLPFARVDRFDASDFIY